MQSPATLGVGTRFLPPLALCLTDWHLQLPDPNHALDTVLFSLLYVAGPMVFAVTMFLLVLRISFTPPDEQDVER